MCTNLITSFVVKKPLTDALNVTGSGKEPYDTDLAHGTYDILEKHQSLEKGPGNHIYIIDGEGIPTDCDYASVTSDYLRGFTRKPESSPNQ